MGLASKQRVVTEKIEAINETRTTTHPLSVAIVVHASLILRAIEMLPEKPQASPLPPLSPPVFP